MKIILVILCLLFCIPALNAGEIAFGVLDTTMITNEDLIALRDKAISFLSNQGQPACLFGYENFPVGERVIIWGEKDTLMGIDLVMNQLGNSLTYLGTLTYHKRDGIIRNADSVLIRDTFNEFREYEIPVGTGTEVASSEGGFVNPWLAFGVTGILGLGALVFRKNKREVNV